MKVDRKSIIAKVKGEESDRQRVSIYVSKSIYESFVASCKADEATPSKVLEYLMREFLSSDESVGKKRKS